MSDIGSSVQRVTDREAELEARVLAHEAKDAAQEAKDAQSIQTLQEQITILQGNQDPAVQLARQNLEALAARMQGFDPDTPSP